MEEAKVTVIFMLPTKNGGYSPQEFSNVIVNARAPVKRLLPELLAAFPEVKMDADEVDLLVQVPDGQNLLNASIQDGCRLVVFPKYGNSPLVKR
ncbi:MAG: hypothetical protein DDG60_08690 [Anaerolineae bacterium]|nr:MAG: hypothetical protein DDG60_08690 [Anaerolineae bacterium]